MKMKQPRTRWSKMIAFHAAVVFQFGMLQFGTLTAHAAEGVGALQTEINQLAENAKDLKVRHPLKTGDKEKLAAHRLVDAQVLYNLKDYSRAAILLMDFVHRYENSSSYPEAVFYLADSLFHRGDYQSAKYYFEQIINKHKGNHYDDALLRLVELSWKTAADAQIKEYFKLLAELPTSEVKPKIPYVRGKFYYFNDQIDEALASFRMISAGQDYYKQAQYFTGACLVRKKDYDAAVEVYQSLIASEAKTDEEKHVIELAHLALGRLLYQKGMIKEAIAAYKLVPRTSKEYDTALYESAWAYVKADEMDKALEALDIFVLTQPKSTLMPDVRVLQGNLLIRLQKWGRATRLFSETRDSFVPVHQRMNQVIQEHRDPAVFFDVLLSENFGDLSVTIDMPEIAVHWVKEDANVKKAMGLIQDLREILSTVEESNQTIMRLEKAISSPSRISMFPVLASARTNALEIENRNAIARAHVIQAEWNMIYHVASAAERAQLEQLAHQRRRLEQTILRLPTTIAGYKARERAQQKELSQMLSDLQQGEILLNQLKAQLVATDKYFADTAGAKGEDARISYKEESSTLRRALAGHQAELDELRQAIALARDTSGIGGIREIQEAQARRALREHVRQEHQMLLSMRGKLGANDAARFDQYAALLTKCDDVDQVLAQFNQTVDENVQLQLAEVRAAINEEKTQLANYISEVAERRTETNQVAGGITYDGFQRVAKRLYDIVVRADVGIIDVAWALKDAKSKELSKLVRQRKMDMKVLDDEFRDILGQKE